MIRQSWYGLLTLMFSAVLQADTQIDVSDKQITHVDLPIGVSHIEMVNFPHQKHTYCSILRGDYQIKSITEIGPKSKFVSFDKESAHKDYGFDFYVEAAPGKIIVLEMDIDKPLKIVIHCYGYQANSDTEHDEMLAMANQVDKDWQNQYDKNVHDAYLRAGRFARISKLFEDADEAGMNTQSKTVALLAGEMAKLLFAIDKHIKELGGIDGDFDAYFQQHQDAILIPVRTFFKNIEQILKTHALREAEKSYILQAYKDLLDSPNFDDVAIRKLLAKIKNVALEAQINILEDYLKQLN